MTQTPSSFTKSEYFAIAWVLFVIALLFLCSRIYIRLKVYGHLKVDDYLVLFAFLCLLTTDILESIEVHNTWIFQGVQNFHKPKPPDWEHVAAQYAKTQWGLAYIFFTGTWAVKGSFLAFYDSLTQRLPFYRRAWWAIIVLTILTYIGSLFAYGFLDGLKFETSLRNEAIIYQFSADFTTDVLITIIPVSLALKSRVPRKQKLFLAGIFSLTLLITLFSLIRFVLNAPWRGATSPSWIGTWSTIEQSVSVIVACLASFRTWVITNNRITADGRSYERQREQREAVAMGGGAPGGGGGGGGRKGGGGVMIADKLGFWRSYGGSTNRPDDDDGSMDIELLDSAQHGLGTPAPAHTNMRVKVEEPSAVAVTPMAAAKGSDAVV